MTNSYLIYVFPRGVRGKGYCVSASPEKQNATHEPLSLSQSPTLGFSTSISYARPGDTIWQEKIDLLAFVRQQASVASLISIIRKADSAITYVPAMCINGPIIMKLNFAQT